MKKASDKQVVDLLIRHIDEPCIEPKTGKNIRDFYIREAKKVLSKIEDDEERERLLKKIREYE